MSKIIDKLFLGDIGNAKDRSFLQNNQVTHILNTAEEIANFFPNEFLYMNIKGRDYDLFQMLPHFDKSADFIHEGVAKGGGTFVHCMYGISRSATNVIAYLMKHRNMSAIDARSFVATKRRIISPNNGFWNQLLRWEQILNERRKKEEIMKRTSIQENAPKEEEKLGQSLLVTKIPSKKEEETKQQERRVDNGLSQSQLKGSNQHEGKGTQEQSTRNDKGRNGGPVGVVSQSNSITSSLRSQKPNVESYLCGKCNFLLFPASEILQHKPNLQSQFESCKEKTFFIGRKPWIRYDSSSNTSKMLCPNPKCRTVIGEIKLSGIRCACGHWQIPGFQVNCKLIKKLE